MAEDYLMATISFYSTFERNVPSHTESGRNKYRNDEEQKKKKIENQHALTTRSSIDSPCHRSERVSVCASERPSKTDEKHRRKLYN